MYESRDPCPSPSGGPAPGLSVETSNTPSNLQDRTVASGQRAGAGKAADDATQELDLRFDGRGCSPPDASRALQAISLDKLRTGGADLAKPAAHLAEALAGEPESPEGDASQVDALEDIFASQDDETNQASDDGQAKASRQEPRWRGKALGWPASAIATPPIMLLIHSGSLLVPLLVVWSAWTGRTLTHVAAGYLSLGEARVAGGDQLRLRRIVRRWGSGEVGTALALGVVLAAVYLHRSSWWSWCLLGLVAAAISWIPLYQARPVQAAGLMTGSEWVRERFGAGLMDGSDVPIVSAARHLNQRRDRSQVGNLSRWLGWVMCAILAASATLGFRPGLLGASPLHRPPTSDVTSDAALQQRYADACRNTTGGPVPGRDAPPWAQAGFYAMYLAKGSGVGSAVGGCVARVHVSSDGFGSTAWGIGIDPITGAVKSVSTYSTSYGPCLVLAPAALIVAVLVSSNVPVGCTGVHRFAADGDAYLVNTSKGCYAFIRGGRTTAAHRPAPYVELPPGASDAWALAEQEWGDVLLVDPVPEGGYELTDEHGTPIGRRISITGSEVMLTSAQSSQVVPGRSQLSWDAVRY
jgi:hypothetical protein